jgi:V/A-type H+-transporting ATPase subunit F
MSNQKIAAIGPSDSVLAFKALGIHAAAVSTGEEAAKAVLRLARDGCAVIFITEDIAEDIPETIERFKARALPAIIPIPGAYGATGLGMRGVRANAQKAVGADILFREEG